MAYNLALSEAISFSDVKSSNWAYESVKAVSEKGVIKGYTDGTFKPNKTVTYAEFIKMVVVSVTDQEIAVAKSPNHWSKNFYDKGLELKLYKYTNVVL